MVEKMKELKILFLIDEKIFNIYTSIKERMYDDKAFDEDIEHLKILLKLEKDELNKLELDYDYLHSLKLKILNEKADRQFDDWYIETTFLMNQLIFNQNKNIKGKNLFIYDKFIKREFITLRIYQNLNLLQTKCLNYPFEDLIDTILNEDYISKDNVSVYLDDVEKISGIYSNDETLSDDLDYDEYVKQALNVDHVLALDPAIRDRLALEQKADYFLKCYEVFMKDKNKKNLLKNFYIDNMINMVYIIPLLEQRLIETNLNILNIDDYISSNIYKNKNNIKFLNIIRIREFITYCDKYLETLIYYDDYNIKNYYLNKHNNVITEFANINIIISSIEASFIDEIRAYLLYDINEFQEKNTNEDNNELFEMLMKSIGEQESKVKTITLK